MHIRFAYFVFGLAMLLPYLGYAAPYNYYPFDDTQTYLAPAAQFTGWAQTLTRHTEQQVAIDRCLNDTGDCPRRLRSYKRVVAKANGLSETEKISLVHFYINRSSYKDDRVQRRYDENGKRIAGQRSNFSTLYEFLTKGGDCEDFATAKYFMLRAMGFAPEQLRVVVTYERKLRGYHAVLAVRRDAERVWLLDSDNMIRKTNHRGYRYVFAMNELSVWDHRADYALSVQSKHALNEPQEPSI